MLAGIVHGRKGVDKGTYRALRGCHSFEGLGFVDHGFRKQGAPT